MKRFSEQLHKQSQTVKLKKSEQAELRERLVSYMEYHPLPAHMKTADISHVKKVDKSAKSDILTDAFQQYAIPYQMLFKFGSVAAVFMLLVVPFMAEQTVPGDTLYAVKVQFNEEVRSTLTWGSYEKVEWETARLNRRIAEARLLADEGLLTNEVEAEVAAAVKEHSDNAKREIEVLRASDADEATIATITFDSSLEVQAQALQSMPAIGGGEAAIDVLATQSPISAAIDQSLEKSTSTVEVAVPGYEKLMVRIELNTTRIRELRDSLAGAGIDQALTDVNRRIEDIDRTITEAVELAQNQETELEARVALVDVLTRTQKLIVFMTDLEVRDAVAIETVVPVVPTPEEIEMERSARTSKLEDAIATITAALEVDLQEGVVEKLQTAKTELQTILEELAIVSDYKAFLVMSDSALQLAADTVTLVDLPNVIPDVVPEESVSTESEVVASSTEDILDENSSLEPEVAEEAEAEVEDEDEVVEETAPSTIDEIDTPES